MASRGDRIRVPKTAELVAGELRRRVIRGELREGDALPPEAILMEQFGVSRPTLREAFRVLESEGLVSIRRGLRGGARVHAPDGEVAARHAGLLLQVRGTTVGDVYRARLLIEPPAAGMLAESGSKASLRELDRLLAAEEAVLDDPPEFGHAAARFHEQVVELAGNHTLAVFAKMLENIIDLHTGAVIADAAGSPTQLKEASAAHRAHMHLVDLVRDGKSVEAEHHWRHHMEALGTYMLKGQASRTLIDLVG